MIKVEYDLIKRKGILSGDHFDEIREHFSAENPAARFMKGYSYIPKRLYPITPTGQFDIGLFNEIQDFVLSKQYNTKFEITDEAKNAINPKFKDEFENNLKYELREYQKDSVKRCLNNGRGVSILGTGAGKTLIIASMLENIYHQFKDKEKFRCLVLVPDLGLVSQTFEDFKEYNVSFSFSKWTGSHELDYDTNIVIANAAILISKSDQVDWWKYVDVLVVDECHMVSNKNKISKIIQKINTPRKFGFTGTLPESKIDKWNVIGKIGNVLMEKSSHSLREENFLTNVSVKIFNIHYKPITQTVSKLSNTTDKYKAELDFIYKNKFRNKVISTTCSNFKNNCLILVNHIAHGQELFSILSSALKDRKVFFIRGDVEVDDRNEIKKLMESSDNIICIAISKIFSTGINIKNLHMIMFASGGKSFIRTVQSIGRGLRLHENKQHLIIIDVSDELRYGKSHMIKRQEIYNKEKIPYSIHIICEK